MSDARNSKVLLVKGVAGLGNRIECLLTAMLYARLSGRRLVIDWTDPEYSKDGANAFHHFFQSPACDAPESFAATDSVSPAIWRGHLHESAWDMRARFGNINDRQTWRTFSIDLGKLDYTEDVLVLWTYSEKIDLLTPHFHGMFEELSRVGKKDILRTLLRDNLTVRPEIQARVDEFEAREFRETTIGVHVRYSDYRTRLWASLEKLNSLLEAEPNARIFLSTDNVRVKRMIQQHYPQMVSTAHWYPPKPGLAIHSHRARPNPIESGIEALVDLYLLAECSHLVIDTSSSFSYVATLLAKAQEANIFDVAVVPRKKGPAFLRRLAHVLMLGTGMYSWGFVVHARLARARGAWRPPVP